MSGYYLSDDMLSDNFVYPSDFRRVIELGLVNIEPWWILQGDLLVKRHNGLKERFPERKLVPFSRRQDNDDVACWDLRDPNKPVCIIHDFSSPGWEQVTTFQNFHDWFTCAIEDMFSFE